MRRVGEWERYGCTCGVEIYEGWWGYQVMGSGEIVDVRVWVRRLDACVEYGFVAFRHGIPYLSVVILSSSGSWMSTPRVSGRKSVKDLVM